MAPDIRRLISRIDKIPTLPFVVTKIMRIVEDPKTSAEDVNKVIIQDQSLTSKVLKLVNSAFYGFPRRITTVSQAIVILGFNTVKSLALSASVLDLFSKIRSEHFNVEKFWEHTIAVGIASQEVAKASRFVQLEEAFVSGLLHDIGKVIIMQYFPNEFSRIINICEERHIHILEAENEVLEGINHCHLGRWLADTWNLPQALVEAAAFHHFPASVRSEYKLAYFVHLADILVRTKNVGSGGDDQVPELNDIVIEKLDITEDKLQSILDDLDKSLASADAFLSMTRK